MEGSQLFLSLNNINFVKDGRDIQLSESFSLSDLVQSFIN